jgi:hypothetical protein
MQLYEDHGRLFHQQWYVSIDVEPFAFPHPRPIAPEDPSPIAGSGA